MKWEYKEAHAFDSRLNESTKIREKYPDRIPVIVEKNPRSDLPNIDKKKFLVPGDLSVSQLQFIIRRRISLPAEKAMFFFVGKGVLMTNSNNVGAIYGEYKDEDGFLYVCYSGESTFGC